MRRSLAIAALLTCTLKPGSLVAQIGAKPVSAQTQSPGSTCRKTDVILPLQIGSATAGCADAGTGYDVHSEASIDMNGASLRSFAVSSADAAPGSYVAGSSATWQDWAIFSGGPIQNLYMIMVKAPMTLTASGSLTESAHTELMAGAIDANWNPFTGIYDERSYWGDLLPTPVTHTALQVSFLGSNLGPYNAFFFQILLSVQANGEGNGANRFFAVDVQSPQFELYDKAGNDITSDYTVSYRSTLPTVVTPEPAVLMLMATGLTAVLCLAPRLRSRSAYKLARSRFMA